LYRADVFYNYLDLKSIVFLSLNDWIWIFAVHLFLDEPEQIA
jgi:hypothetical protein